MPRRGRRQQQIIRNYYLHRDEIMMQSLGELVSELFVADSPAKRDRLWGRVEAALGKLGVDEKEIRGLVRGRSAEALADFVSRRF